MKIITVNEEGRKLLGNITEYAPMGQGFTYASMCKRNRILDAMNAAAGDTVEIEDADHAELKHIVETFPGFLRATKETEATCRAVFEAKAKTKVAE